jgi:hypothetical protein
LDKKRYEEEGKEAKLKEILLKSKNEENKKKEQINYRLIQDYECPTWIHGEDFHKEEEEEIRYGKGMRKKANINYKDDNEDFENDNENDSDEDSLLKKRKRDNNNNNNNSNSNSKFDNDFLLKKRRIDVGDDINSKSSLMNNDNDNEYDDVYENSNSIIVRNNKNSTSTKMRINLESNSIHKSGKIRNYYLINIE